MKRRDFVVLFGGAAVILNQEVGVLRSQIAISNIGRGGRRYLPYAFTEPIGFVQTD